MRYAYPVIRDFNRAIREEQRRRRREILVVVVGRVIGILCAAFFFIGAFMLILKFWVWVVFE